MTTPTELLERSGSGDAGVTRENGADRLRQDGAMNKQSTLSDGSARLPEPAARRPERIALQFAIEVCGFDRCGRFFTERSETCNVSAGGCKFYLRTEVDREAIVALRVIERFEHGRSNASPVLFQVAHMERESSGWTLGALKLRADDWWPMQMALAGGAG
jgi:hypothetical protein